MTEINGNLRFVSTKARHWTWNAVIENVFAYSWSNIITFRIGTNAFNFNIFSITNRNIRIFPLCIFYPNRETFVIYLLNTVVSFVSSICIHILDFAEETNFLNAINRVCVIFIFRTYTIVIFIVIRVSENDIVTFHNIVTCAVTVVIRHIKLEAAVKTVHIHFCLALCH